MKVVWRVRLSQRAETDFTEILKWTALHFSIKQAREYAKTLRLAIGALTEGPEISGVQKRDELGSGIRTLHVARQGRKGSHFVVFRGAADQTVEVLRILHESMDLIRHLPVHE